MAVYANQGLGDAINRLLGAGGGAGGNPSAIGQAMLGKAQMDRQNQETLARDALGDIIANSAGTDPRALARQAYGQAVQVSDAFAGNMPQFYRGLGMHAYGTDQVGQQYAADLATGAGDSFTTTQLGQAVDIAGQNWRNDNTGQWGYRESMDAPMTVGEGQAVFDPAAARAGGGGLGSVVAPAGGMGPTQAALSSLESGDWLRYANDGATRNQPISGELQQALSFLPSMGIEMEVFSGGQAPEGSGGPRVGSTRHDHGNAADVFFYQNGRRLDWRNPDDVPVLQRIVQTARQNGVTGFGAGEGYMQPGSMHIGFGNEAVWGAGGQGENAPQWLRDAYYGTGATPASAPGVMYHNPQATTVAPTEALYMGDRLVQPPNQSYVDSEIALNSGQAAQAHGAGDHSTANAERVRADIAAGAPAADVALTYGQAGQAGGAGDQSAANAELIRADIAAGAPAANVELTGAEAQKALGDFLTGEAMREAGLYGAQAEQARGAGAASTADANMTDARRESGQLYAPSGDGSVAGVGIGDTDAFMDMEARDGLEAEAVRALMRHGAPDLGEMDPSGRSPVVDAVLEAARRMVASPSQTNDLSVALDAAASTYARRVRTSGVGDPFRPNQATLAPPPPSAAAPSDPAPNVGFRIVE